MSAVPGRCIACGDLPVPTRRGPGLQLLASPGCGLEWRHPLPSESELESLYGPGYFERWGVRDRVSLQRVRAMKQRSYARLLRAVAAHRAGGRLLDVGCAAGFLMESARGRGYQPFGLDLSAEAVAYARRSFGRQVECGRLEDPVFPGIRFDVVTLVDVFEHVTNPAGLLAAALERLAPDGVLAAVMPNAASWTRRLLGSRWPHYAPEHVFYWTPRSLRRFLADRGWRVLALRTGFRKTFTADYLGAYAACVGSWLPPGLSLLGSRSFTVPTGEMLVIAAPPAADSAPAAAPAADSRG